MNTNDENVKKSQLLQLAQQGNEEALAQLLNQALAHKQIKTVVKLTEDQLKISLVAPQIPEPWSSKVLLDRELLKIHWSNTPTIQVQGYQKGLEDPAWTEEFLLGTQTQATKTHSSEKQIIPVEESQKKRKKYQVKLPTKPIEKAGWQALAIGLLLAIILQRVLDNDFVILARDYLNVDLSIVAGFFLVGCIFTPLVAFLLFRYEQVWLGGISNFLSSK